MDYRPVSRLRNFHRSWVFVCTLANDCNCLRSAKRAASSSAESEALRTSGLEILDPQVRQHAGSAPLCEQASRRAA